MNYTIRPAALADVAGVVNVARLTWNATYAESIAAHNRQQFLAQAYTTQAIQEAVTSNEGWFFVASQHESVAGFAQYLRRFDGHGELVRLYVHPDHQRQGIGSSLLAAGSLAMTSAGISRCYVSVEASNGPARTFYERCGFREYREYGHFFGDQIIRLVEYTASISRLLSAPGVMETAKRLREQN
jgi:ribosomal protein S18 acetylase RimI-like enzyme